jgi:carotenoid cleavage dioxygenase-like enzyme
MTPESMPAAVADDAAIAGVPTQPPARRADRSAGFASLEEELRIDRLPSSGEIPEWLGGTLVRVTPALLDVGGEPIRHWFDGLAMLNAFSFAGGEVSYGSRFLQTDAYRKARAGKLDLIGFANDPCRSLFKRVAAMFDPNPNDNANVNLTRLGDRYVAMTEVPMPVEFDPETLDTVGLVGFDDRLGGHTSTAHPHHDRERNELVSYVTHYSRRSSYRVYGLPAGASQRRRIAKIPVSEPAYMHSFGMTERYVVLVEFPLVVNPTRMLVSGKPFIHNFRWKPERGARFRIVDRHSGELAGTFESEAFFAYHHVNAFERDGEVVVDIVAYEDPASIELLEVEKLRAPQELVSNGYLTRYRVPLARGGEVTGERLSDISMELPRIDYRRRNTREYGYAYATGARSESSDWFDQLVKVDVAGGETASWHEDATYPGEPVFVPSPGGSAEDDGVILSAVLDAESRRSFLLVLDAASFEELGRTEVPHAIPFGFHGQYFGAA